jgi:UDP-N-acetylmuramyl pentapeptide phosphotransferase/UDP-N-acetylglucosamine-1-phosphate transferase
MNGLTDALLAGLIGAATTGAATAGLEATPPGGAERWARSNYGDRTVSLLGGAAVALGATAGGAVAGASLGGATVGLAGAVAGAAGGAFGALDDLTEDQAGRSKGFRGHVGALAHGTVTTGAAKLLGISAGSMLAAAIATRGGRGTSQSARLADVVLSGALIAGTANLVNLFDLRPGRGLKAIIALSAPVALAGGPGAPLAAATCGAALSALPDDLAERTMLGDTGANALGALAGTALVLTRAWPVRAAVLVGVLGLTALSERVSFSRVIDATPALRAVDTWGRAHR